MGAAGPETMTGPLAALRMAVWFGLMTGLLEAGLLLVRGLLDNRVTHALQRLNHHALWMIPITNLLLFGVVGLVLAPLVWAWPRTGTRLITFLNGFLAGLALLQVVGVVHISACVVLAGGLGTCLTAWVLARSRSFHRVVRRSLPVLLVAVAALTCWEYRRVARAESRFLAGLPAAAPQARNVLLIVMDTVRADHLSLFGYGRDTAPNLARLAPQGVRYANARSAAPWTLPSHASILTGRWPHELSARYARPIETAYPTLAEFLSRRGYATAGFVANTFYCNARYGFDRGFARYEDFVEKGVVSPREALLCSELGRRLVQAAWALGFGLPADFGIRKDAARINRDFLSWLADREGKQKRPFFAFLNYLDAHDPYILPPGFEPRFGAPSHDPADRSVLQEWDRLSKWRLPQRQIDLALDAYDNCIAYLDDQLGRLFDDLERRGVLKETLVIVTADHGESFGEHQLYGHWRSLYRSEVHVPLLIIGPGRVPAGRVIDQPVSLRDLPATVADLLGLSAAAPFPGRSLAACWESAAASAGPVLVDVVPQATGPGHLLSALGPTRSIVAEGKVYIQNPFGREELYDLEADPTEEHNLAAAVATRPLLLRFRDALDGLSKDKDGARPRPAD